MEELVSYMEPECDRMIMGITSEVLFAVKISIVYDDNRQKNVIVKEGDMIRVVYIDKNSKKEIVGKAIRCTKENIIIDHSKQYDAKQTTVDIQTIREIYLDKEPMPLD